ncbi:MAG: hypothetical protein J7M38_00650 [Armatimonadetes bacterium]|nr:hypothetical protein [Armatimonadota bacterium]
MTWINQRPQALNSSIAPSLSVRLDKPLKKKRIDIGIYSRLRIALLDQTEKLVVEKEHDSHSFLHNFIVMLYNILTNQLAQATNINGSAVTPRLQRKTVTVSYEVEGKTTSYSKTIAGWQAWALKEDDSHGILIGKGTDTVTPYDYKLADQIPNGIGAGKMLYLDCVVKTHEVLGDIARVAIERRFVNASGNTITVTEFGLAVYDVSSGSVIMIIRDLVEPIEVPNEYVLKVTYSLVVQV